MRRILATALLGAALLALGAGTAQAQPVSPAADSWSVSYQSAHAGGTYSVTSDFLYRTYTIDGQLTNSGSGCYHVLYLVQDDLAGYGQSSAAQCGSGTLPLHFSASVSVLGAVSVGVCAGQPDDNNSCGPFQQL
jgi:opacity protein-like surface antigen